jgi:hypothetical protein
MTLLLAMVAVLESQPPTVLEQGDVAPATGVFLLEPRFSDLLAAEVERDRLKLHLEECERIQRLMKRAFEDRLRSVPMADPWYKRKDTLVLVGGLIGVVATVAWLSVQELVHHGCDNR